MIVVGALVLILLSSFVVSVLIMILELLAVVVAILLILVGLVLFVGGRWWGRSRIRWGGASAGNQPLRIA